MKQQEGTETAELPGMSRRGRKPLGDRAMTNAERQKAYRERKREEVFFSRHDEASRVALMQRLAYQLRAMDEGHEFAEGAQALAEEVIAEIVTRYALRHKRLNALVRKAEAERTGNHPSQ
ncbi:hypothetical protein [Pelomonas cellulosilytica]|uniref:Uncharacterized protein n=1 Tax=Pelomonas cellulosilytica TaxID=2906762 RepID=A0ABS8XTF8_9BURK|nr:hypothetical protein [Pelomonas sp. P8]MCE4555005.1 hypothetical protein [Pelomonas sp. P8]